MAIEIKIEGYDAFEQIAVGGMAAVYKARKVSIDKVVAIKVLFPYLANDVSFIDRFQREAKSAAKVQHENIVNVIDYGESGGCYFIVMEFYEGVTVADLLKNSRRIPLDIAVTIILDVCLGLEAAHAQDIVHRDIKPANIIYTNVGGIKIADFGLAKKPDTMTVVTQPGKVLGTPAYMSPEQAAGEAVGAQSDIFSLGVVAFEMLCNKRPFDGSSYSEVIEKIQTQNVPALSHENPLIQPDFEGIVARMLERDLSRRYGSIAEVTADWERAMEAFSINRDRRRLIRYLQDPDGYDKAFSEKMVARCLSQGTYFMQKGETHITEAMIEFKRILYLDPTNERARKHLAKIMAEFRRSDSTVTLDLGEKRAREKRPAPHDREWMPPAKPARESRPARNRAGKGARNGRSIVVAALAVLGATGAVWWGWTQTGALRFRAQAPVLSAPSRLAVKEGDTVAFSVRATDADGDSVRLYSKGLPAGAVLSPSGELTWVVRYDQAGEHILEFVGDDGEHLSSGRTVVEVTDKPVNVVFDPPAEKSASVGERVSVKLQAASQAGNPVTFALEGAPEGMALDGDRITWVPTVKQAGSHRVAVRGSDGVASATQTVVIQVKPASATAPAPMGRVDWILPKLANIYVDGALKVRGDAYLSIDLPEGKHTVRAELIDGITVLQEVVNVRPGSRATLDPPKIEYGRLSVYFLGGVGELKLNGKKFKQQPPFTGAAVPMGRYLMTCSMFRNEDSMEFQIVVKKGETTVVEYEVGNEPTISYENE
jgi:serine/threonine protein kinase